MAAMPLMPRPPRHTIEVGDTVELTTTVVVTRGVVKAIVRQGTSASGRRDNGSGPILAGNIRTHGLDALRKIS